MLEDLDRDSRLRLMRFVCSFAWADLEVRRQEREFIARMVERLDLDPGERQSVERWLQVPPPPDAIDPTQIPARHRKLFIEAVEGVVRADGEVAPEEREHLELLKELLA